MPSTLPGLGNFSLEKKLPGQLLRGVSAGPRAGAGPPLLHFGSWFELASWQLFWAGRGVLERAEETTDAARPQDLTQTLGSAAPRVRSGLLRRMLFHSERPGSTEVGRESAGRLRCSFSEFILVGL